MNRVASTVVIVLFLLIGFDLGHRADGVKGGFLGLAAVAGGFAIVTAAYYLRGSPRRH